MEGGYDDDWEAESGDEKEGDGGRPDSTATTALSVPAATTIAVPVAVVEGKVDGGCGDAAAARDDRDGAAAWLPLTLADVEVGRQLGGGGFAVVYGGKLRGTTPVAVKMIVDPTCSRDQMESFMHELHVMAGLHHDCVVRLLGACTTPPRPFFVMELGGMSLFDVLHGVGASPGTRAVPHIPTTHQLSFALDAAKALHYCHTRRPVAIIHRDVKTANLLVTRPTRSGGGLPHVKLCDWGLVGVRSPDAGTPAYMAPELLAARPFNKSVDVYAFGVVLWEIFSRCIPFHGWTPVDVQQAVVTRNERPRLSALAASTPASIEPLICRCWDATPSNRPDMGEVVDVLSSALAAACAVGDGGGGTARGGSGVAMGDSLDALAGGKAPAWRAGDGSGRRDSRSSSGGGCR